jgi:hypothetical protein
VGPERTPAARVAVAVFGAGLMHSGVDPDLAGLDDATLRAHLVEAGRRLLSPKRGTGSASRRPGR